MVEGQHFIEEHQAGIRHAEIVFGQLGQTLDLPHHVIGKEADRARGKGRQPGDARGLMSRQQLLQQREDVALARIGACRAR